jgi:integrase
MTNKPADSPPAQKAKKRKPRERFGTIRPIGKRHQASYMGPDNLRHNAPHTFSTITDARAWLVVIQSRIVDQTWTLEDAAGVGRVSGKKIETLAVYGARWTEQRTNSKGKPLSLRSKSEYRRLFRGPISTIAEMKLDAITPEIIREWYASLMATGRQTQAGHAYQHVKSIMETAVQDGIIYKNPCMIRGAGTASTGRKIKPPKEGELDIILDMIPEKYKALIITGAWAACRWGEATELRRKDVLIVPKKNGKGITVFLNIERGVTHTIEDGYTIGSTKSEAGVRMIAMPPHTNDIMLNHLDRFVDEGPESLLFHAVNDTTAHLAPSTFEKHWSPARKAAGRAKDLPFHALRHYGATEFAASGATLKDLQGRLGHSTVKAAMRYQHSTGRDEELAEKMSKRAAKRKLNSTP